MGKVRVMLGVCVLLGCLGGALGSTNVASAASKYGGSITYITTGGPWVSMDPENPTIPPATAAMFPYIEPLFQLRTNGTIAPWLALGAKVSDGGLRYTINLRHNVKFQDGTPFNAQAVVYNFDRYASSSIATECYTYFSVVTGTTAAGKYTVVVTLSSPDSAFLSYLGALQCGLMVSPTAYQAEGSGFGTNPVGTGPFKFVSGTPGTTSTFARWNGYWGGKPYLDRVTITETTSDSVALDELETGGAQIMPLGQDLYSQAKAQPSLQVEKAPAASINYVTFSYTHGPFDNPEAREAVFYASNAASIRSNLYQNFYPTAEGVLPPSDIGYQKSVKGYLGYDLAKAQQLVAKLGGLSFTLWTGNTTAGVTEAEALQAMWQAAGMHVSINSVAAAALIAANHAHTYDALLITSPASSSSDQTIYRFFYSGSPINQGGMVDPLLNKWILEARRTYRIPVQQALYQKINTRLEAVDYAWMDLYSAVTYQALSKRVVNFPDNPFGYHYWATTYLK